MVTIFKNMLAFGLSISILLTATTMTFPKVYANPSTTPPPIICRTVGCNGFPQLNNTNNTEAPSLGATTADREINEIIRQLSPPLSGKEPIALKAALTKLQEQIHNMGQNSNQIIFFIGGQILQDGSSGPISQSLILLARKWLENRPQNANQTITLIANKIAKIEPTASFNQIIETILQSATSIATGGSNNTNNEINKISNLVTQRNATLSDPVKQVLYQIGLEVANKGGNMSKAIRTIDSSITQNPMMVDFAHLPMVKTLLNVAKFKVNGNTNIINQIIDKVTSQAVANRNENSIGKLLTLHSFSFT